MRRTLGRLCLVLAPVALLLGITAGSLLAASGSTPGNGPNTGRPVRSEGTVTKVSADSVTIAPRQPVGRNAATKFTIARETRIVARKGGRRTTPELQVGDRVRVEGWASADGRTNRAQTIVVLAPAAR